MNGEIFDLHIMAGRYPHMELAKAQSWNLAESVANIVAEMDRHGIGRGAVCSFESLCYDFESGNEHLAEAIAPYNGRLVGFATVHPLFSSAAKVLTHAVRDLGMRGLKLHPRLQSFDPLDPAVYPLMKTVADLGIPVMFHTGSAHESTRPSYLGRLAKAFPSVPFIFAHMGGMNPHFAVRVALECENVILETSACGYLFESMKNALAAVGSGRIAYASDFPCSEVAIELAKIGALPLDEVGRRQVLGGNARRLLEGNS